MKKIALVLLFSITGQAFAFDCSTQEKAYKFLQNQYENVQKTGSSVDALQKIESSFQGGNIDTQKQYLDILAKARLVDAETQATLTRIGAQKDKALRDFNACVLAPTNDPLSGYQDYLRDLRITYAWSKVKNPKQVVVAIIDDGIDTNHPDLKKNIWVNPKQKYGANKIIDFSGERSTAGAPTGEHGTMVAGIIGAIQNNNEGIAGVAKSVKLMPLKVFGSDGNAKESNIIKAIAYAIDNKANIINLSLGGNQFVYSTKYDAIIKKAYDKGIIIVIAAGNGDVLSKQETGLNLDENPVSPVCNNGGGKRYSLGVVANTNAGFKTSWTNYGDNCAPFFAPGEQITSASIPAYNMNNGGYYNTLDGTSFSAPIISGIIALGYNQYGYVPPSVVYDSLRASIQKNWLNGDYIDVPNYLDNLGAYITSKKR